MPINLKPLDNALQEHRRALAREAARIYRETKSLRKAADQLNVSHETVRALLREASADADAPTK